MSRFKPAVREQARLRLALDGPAGSGKSYTALRFAFAFPDARVACVEAGEHGRLSLYKGESPDGRPWEFDVAELRGNYSPTEYTQAIEDAGREKYDILVVDSLSHAWVGIGGALDQVGAAGFTDRDGWRKVTPQHNRMIDAILGSPCHVIATLRCKQEYVIEEDERGKKVPRKIGLAPIQRSGMEYEFDVYGSMDPQNTLTVTKSRCPLLQGAIAHKPGATFLRPLIEWLQTGAATTPVEVARRVSDDQVDRIGHLLTATRLTMEQIKRGLSRFGVEHVRQLTDKQAEEFEQMLKIVLGKAKVAPTPIDVPDPGRRGVATATAETARRERYDNDNTVPVSPN